MPPWHPITMDDVKAVIKIAKATNPDDARAIDTMYSAYQARRADMKAAEEEAKFADAGLFDNITGEGEIGAFRSTGNSSNTGVSGGIKLQKDGRKWRHKFRAAADYQRSNGVTTREQFLAALETNYKFSDRAFAYGLAQYERDRFQGYSARYSLSGGLGYSLIDDDDMKLDVKAGPAYRKTNFTGGTSDSSIAALAALDYRWKIDNQITFTEAASAYLQSGNSSYASATGVEAQISGALSARLSYSVEHETNPPLGRIKTDTLSRFTLVYGF